MFATLTNKLKILVIEHNKNVFLHSAETHESLYWGSYCK